MTQTEIIRSKLLKAIESHKTTANKIKDRKAPNPFPIGTRAVYVFATQGHATDSHKWKLFEFFNKD